MKVHRLPKSVTLPDSSVIVNPTPEQCIEAGYALYTAEELMAQEEARQQAEQLRQAEIAALRSAYANAVAQFCRMAGIPVVAKFEDATVVAYEINKANEEQDIPKALGLTQLALQIQTAILELRRKDGDDAWERI